MAKTTVNNKATETKKVAPKKVTEKKVEAREVKKVVEKAKTISWDEVNELYASNGIQVHNAKSKDYRAMGLSKGGSSLNIRKGSYIIYSTDADFENLKELKMDGLTVEKGTNSTDSSRPNTVICATVEVLKKVLPVYAQNDFNKVVTTK